MKPRTLKSGSADVKSSKMMSGKTVIVTGANSGIGRATAAGIVTLQGRVIMACRDVSRAEEAARELRQETGADSAQLVVKQLDLASIKSIHTFCNDIIKVAAVWRILIKSKVGFPDCESYVSQDTNGKPNVISKIRSFVKVTSINSKHRYLH